ncbi:MAG: glycerol-3-phosphate dehydrogenase [Deltaproteobacteria bacterium]|nr:glycerol-3-phosphate dehydrogenase [Deltaproteobacteria bacterium]
MQTMTMSSIMAKHRQFRELGAGQFDALVIGGGITGAGTARDLALRGLRVALVDKRDFASGTSSRSTKLIHGGLRYLEQLAFGLVFESCRERHYLRQIAPHLVKPLPLMFPLYDNARRSPGMVRCGLMFYDLLALFRSTHVHRMLSAEEALRRQPNLASPGLRGAALYWDCQMDDARLCLENVISAREAGAVTVNYASVDQLLYRQGAICGAVVKDTETGEEIEVFARTVVNSTGPWLDQICALDGENELKLQPTRGTHILVPRISPNEEGLYLSAEQDDRMFFVLPWGDLSLIGTTDIEVSDPDHDDQETEEEIAYLLNESRHYLPGLSLQRSDIVASFAGLRPLLAHGRMNPSQASREHMLFESKSGLLSIGGGKYTTYRAMAAELADRVVTRLGNNARPSSTHRSPLPGGKTGPFRIYCTDQAKVLGRQFGLCSKTIAHLLERYGSRTEHVLAITNKDPALARPVAEGVPLLECEVAYAAKYEMARTVDDVLRRRTSLALQPGHGAAARTQVATLLRKHDQS